ncbi:MAG: META domain-containing protein, partial [Syntrophobacteraceae bacterium]|nr:META domain-containing protein [Syntrophobacteraceae bacterium]
MTTQTSPPALTGVTWYLVAFDKGGSSQSVLPGTGITAFFDPSGVMSGSAGCNQYTASYSGSLNGLSIGAPASTKMYCESPAGIMNQETLYLTTIQGASSYSISGNILTVNDSGGKAILTYSTVPPYEMTPAPLTGTMWYLNSFVDAKGNFWTPGKANPISLQFGTDGKVGGNAGCNTTLSNPTFTSHLFALYALIRKDWKQYWRYPLNAISSVFHPLVWIAPVYFMGLAFSSNGKAEGFA